MAVTLAHVSDTHLSQRHGWFVANWRRVRQSIAAHDGGPPALVVNSGDVSVNGVGAAEDLSFAASQHERIGLAWRAVPGNHDVGEEPGAAHIGQPTDAVTHQSWADSIGPSWWSVDLSGWRLVGIDAFLFGTGMEAEAKQEEFVVRAVGEAPGPVGIFTHKPLCIETLDEAGVDPVWTMHPAGLALLSGITRGVRSPVRFVATGHLHQFRRRQIDGVEHVWAPSTAFCGEQLVTHDSVPTLGWLRWTFDSDRYDVELVEPPSMDRHGLEDLRAGADWLYLAPPAPPEPDDLV
jgi:3',5'-cyclic AMP phosphodiesterase CpdA